MSAQRWLSYAYADISPHPSNTKGTVVTLYDYKGDRCVW